MDASGNFIWAERAGGLDNDDVGGGIAVDGSGSVYVTDSTSRIQKFTSSGTFVTKWGTIGTEDGQFHYAYGVAVDSPGYVYVTDTDNNRIQKFRKR